MNQRQSISCCFLILHYINTDLTNRTVESVLGLHNFENSQIVIVDNASPNGSGKVLEEKYKEIKQIHVILSSVNAGFSAGNNLGFRYIKNFFVPEFVIAINNDILFPQKEFINRMKELYLEAPFWVAGPDILIPQREYHSSPLSSQILGIQETEAHLKEWEYRKKMFAKKFSFRAYKYYIRDCCPDNVFLKQFFRLKRFFQRPLKQYDKRDCQVVLQGSCLIFDRRYCEKNDNLFLPFTFMYAEEDILTWQCIRNNWVVRYFPEIQVWHIGEGSSNFFKISYRQYCNKRIIKLGKLQEAYKIYLKLIR